MSELKNQYDNEDEIDLIELLKKVYLEKRFIIKSSIISVVFGLLLALIQPNQYTSSTTFIPQLTADVKAEWIISKRSCFASRYKLRWSSRFIRIPPNIISSGH